MSIRDRTRTLIRKYVGRSYRGNGKVVAYLKGRFSADYFTDRLIGFLQEGAKDKRPFRLSAPQCLGMDQRRSRRERSHQRRFLSLRDELPRSIFVADL